MTEKKIERYKSIERAYKEIERVHEEARTLIPAKYLGWNWVHALVGMVKKQEGK